MTNPTEIIPTEAGDPSRNPAAVYLASLPSPQSRRTMRTCLATMAALLSGSDTADPLLLPWARLTYAHTAALRARLIGRMRPATVNKYLAALRGVIAECRRLGLIGADAAAAAGDLKRVKGEGLPRGRMLSLGEQAALMRACADGTVKGARDAALLAVLLGCGLRRAEVVALNIGDCSEDSLTVQQGKGRTARSVPLPAGTRQALAAWRTLRGEAERNAALFTSLDRRPEQRGGRISDQAVFHILQQRTAQAGVSGISPHDLRRTFISQLLDAGVDIVTVQQMAGHANVQTTARYDRRGEQARQRAAERIHVPYFQSQVGETSDERQATGISYPPHADQLPSLLEESDRDEQQAPEQYF